MRSLCLCVSMFWLFAVVDALLLLLLLLFLRVLLRKSTGDAQMPKDGWLDQRHQTHRHQQGHKGTQGLGGPRSPGGLWSCFLRSNRLCFVSISQPQQEILDPNTRSNDNLVS